MTERHRWETPGDASSDIEADVIALRADLDEIKAQMAEVERAIEELRAVWPTLFKQR